MMRGEERIVEANSGIESGGEVVPNWVIKVNEELRRLVPTVEWERWRKQSIYRIPLSVKQQRSSAYEPQMVSIGPYHHGEERLKSMEEHKRRALHTFLARSNKPLHCYVDALAPLVEDLRGVYRDLDSVWKDDTEAFLQLVIIDGCFILETMRTTTADPESLARLGYERDHPVFSKHGGLRFVPLLRRDMLILDNQIPLPLLAILLEAEDGIPFADALSKVSMLILKFFSQRYKVGDMEEYGRCTHILELYRRSVLLRLPYPKTSWPKMRFSGCLPGRAPTGVNLQYRSATELAEAGIRFKQSKTRHLNGISFRGRVLKLPRIAVDDALELESRYLNMIALERLNVDAGTTTEVASFVVFMDSIIQGARDVELLHSRGIIRKALSRHKACSDEDIAALFNSMSRDIVLDPDSGFAAVLDKLAAYYEMPLPRCTVYSNRMYDYVRTNWISLSVLGAVSLFALTAIQALYAVLAYYHSS